jgi:ABC-2 type transport system permease protein
MGRLVAAQLRSQMQYRGSFFFQAAGQFVATGMDFVETMVFLHAFPHLNGWTLPELALLYGIGGVAFAISDMACGGFDRLSQAIQQGTFDRVLTRPASTFAQVLGADFQLRRLGRIAQAALVLGIALSLLEIVWSPLKIAVLVSAIVSGVAIFGGIWVVGAAVTFWTIQTSEVTNIFTYGGSEMIRYPISIFSDLLRRFFTFVVPLAFVSYLPGLFILNRSDPTGLPPEVQLISPLVAALFLAPAYGAWKLGVRHYQSTGS